MAIYNQSWLHTIAHDLQAADVNGNLWQSICYHYGITQTVNGTWLEALCDFFNVNKEEGEAWIQALAEDFGATAPVNGSWIQALALQIQANADLIDIFMDRIATDGGVFEAETCLEITLNSFDI
jgi:hypothetical protein